FGHLAEKENSLAAYALALYDELLQKFGNETDIIIKVEVASTTNCKGLALYYLKRKEDAIKAYDACIQKFGNETDIVIKAKVAQAMSYKSIVLQ
ncbi:MAG: hypothetical protein IIT54_06285, partial [Acetobacter sp.]|nr:hypothetical protein [Acetobacter sp.]